MGRQAANRLSLVARPLVASGIAAALLSSGHASADRFNDDAERQLRAIRKALVEATSQAPTRVTSAAWIDRDGALHESSQFHSELKVRGVRLSPRKRETSEDDDWDALVDVELPAHLRVGPAARDCAPEPSGWRMPVALEVIVAPELHDTDSAIAAHLSRQTQMWWVQEADRLLRWQPTGAGQIRSYAGLPNPWSMQASTGWGYRQALLGAPQAAAFWRLRLEIGRATGEPATRALTLSFGGDEPAKPLWRMRSVLPALPSPSFTGQEELSTLRGMLEEWRRQADSIAACEPPQFHLTRGGEDGWSIPVGPESGFRVGQRVLIIDRQRMPRRLIEPGSLGELAMAEVSRVSPTRVDLKQLAGPPLRGERDWVALPY